MTNTAQSQTDRLDPTVIAAQNDAFRKLACLGVPPAQSVQGCMHVTRSLMEADDGFMAEAVKATGEFVTFEPENDPEGWHDFGAVGECPIFCVTGAWSMLPERSKDDDDDDFQGTAGRTSEGLRAA